MSSEHVKNDDGDCTVCHEHPLYSDGITRVPWPCTVAQLAAELKRIRAVVSLAGVLANLDAEHGGEVAAE